jgi:FlaA1/EpsC-like NDP-sugar epimerase
LVKWNANTIFLISRGKENVTKIKMQGSEKIKMNPLKIEWSAVRDQWRVFLILNNYLVSITFVKSLY